MFTSGGGVALLYATKVLENLEPRNEDQKRGVEIIQQALKVFYFIYIYIKDKGWVMVCLIKVMI